MLSRATFGEPTDVGGREAAEMVTGAAPGRQSQQAMRVLFLTPELPPPADSGGTIKAASILDYLRRRHEAHVLCFRRRPLTDEQSRWSTVVGQVETLLLDRGRTPLSLLSSYLRGLPLSVERNRSAAMT